MANENLKPCGHYRTHPCACPPREPARSEDDQRIEETANAAGAKVCKDQIVELLGMIDELEGSGGGNRFLGSLAAVRNVA